jgi:hypothetical protein
MQMRFAVFDLPILIRSAHSRRVLCRIPQLWVAAFGDRCLAMATQDFILGYFPPSLRDCTRLAMAIQDFHPGPGPTVPAGLSREGEIPGLKRETWATRRIWECRSFLRSRVGKAVVECLLPFSIRATSIG